MEPGMAGGAEGDQKRYRRVSRPAMMDGDRPLALGLTRTEPAGMAVALEDLGAEAGEVVLVPVPPGVAAGAEAGDQLPCPAAGPTP